MKPKTQKRLEAIQRLERSVRDLGLRSVYFTEKELQHKAEKRQAEALRLRIQFKL